MREFFFFGLQFGLELILFGQDIIVIFLFVIELLLLFIAVALQRLVISGLLGQFSSLGCEIILKILGTVMSFFIRKFTSFVSSIAVLTLNLEFFAVFLEVIFQFI